MHMEGLDLRSLEIFRTVAVEGSITKAAIKLNRVQSNISTRIKLLERHLKKNLFLRQNRGLTLTPDGVLLLSYAERFFQLSMEASEALNEGKPSGVFRIGTMESTAAARLPEILSRYHRLYPDVAIELETDCTPFNFIAVRDADQPVFSYHRQQGGKGEPPDPHGQCQGNQANEGNAEDRRLRWQGDLGTRVNRSACHQPIARYTFLKVN